jgi:hypothetical protein
MFFEASLERAGELSFSVNVVTLQLESSRFRLQLSVCPSAKRGRSACIVRSVIPTCFDVEHLCVARMFRMRSYGRTSCLLCLEARRASSPILQLSLFGI